MTVVIIGPQDRIIHNPQLPQNYHFHFVKTTSRTKEKDYFFSLNFFFKIKDNYICLTGISNIIKHINTSLVTRFPRRYKLFTTSKKSICAVISHEINFFLH